MIILKDITEIVRSEYVKTVEKVTDIMIASASHDMRTPLNTVINMIKLI
jgi:K+-sensing histidine kinase KdpD